MENNNDRKLLIIPKGDNSHLHLDEDVLYTLDINTKVKNNYTIPRLMMEPSTVSVVQHGQLLYFVGIQHDVVSCKRYNATSDKWLDLAHCFSSPLVGSSLCIQSKQIIVAGGSEVSSGEDLYLNPTHVKSGSSDVLLYSIEDNHWRHYCNVFPVKVAFAGITTLKDVSYLCGGMSKDGNRKVAATSERVFSCKLQSDWPPYIIEVAPMHHARYQFSLKSVNVKIYAIGSARVATYYGTQICRQHIEKYCSYPVNVIEVYDPKTNQWTSIDKESASISTVAPGSFA